MQVRLEVAQIKEILAAVSALDMIGALTRGVFASLGGGMNRWPGAWAWWLCALSASSREPAHHRPDHLCPCSMILFGYAFR